MCRLRVAGAVVVLVAMLCSCNAAGPGARVARTESSPSARPTVVTPSGCNPPQRQHAYAVAVGPHGELAWTVPLPVTPTGDPPEGVPVTDGTTSYVAESGSVHAIDVATGRQLWAKRFGDDIFGIWALPAAVVVLADQVSTHALLSGVNPASGGSIWVQRLPGAGALGEPVATADGGLALVRADGTLVVFDAATGKIRWTVPGRRAAGLASLGRTVVHGSEAGSVVGYDSQNGRELWRRTNMSPDPALQSAAGVVLVTASSVGPGSPTGMVALDPADGSTRWRFDPGGEPPTLLGSGRAGTAVSYSNARGLALLDPADGRPRWKVRTANSTDAQGVGMSPDDLLVQEGDVADQKRLELVDRRASDGRVRWRVRLGAFIPNVRPVVSSGAVVVVGPRARTGADDAVRGYDMRTGRLSWSRDLPGAVERPPAVAQGRLIFWAGDLSFACAL